jgi:hypothetical protein
MNKKVRIAIIVVLILAIIATVTCVLLTRVKIKEYSNSNFRVKYDTTWKVKDSKDELYLVHKKTNSELRNQCKVLESNYIDTSLDDIIDDVIYGIEEQNKDYDLINRSSGVSEKYDSYSYLYEKDDKQVAVNIYKKDAKLVIAYYEADTKYFDIVLVSADEILKSVEFVFE